MPILFIGILARISSFFSSDGSLTSHKIAPGLTELTRTSGASSLPNDLEKLIKDAVDQTLFEKGGLNPKRFMASFEEPPYSAWMKVSGSSKKFIYKEY